MVARLFTNWPHKLGALILAIILSSYVHGLDWTSASTTTEIEAANLQAGYELSLAQTEVTIPLSGPRNKVLEAKTQLRASIDLSGLHAGTQTVPIKIVVPDGLSTYVGEPSARRVTITIEPSLSRRLPVEMKVLSAPPVGWVVSEPSITPGTASVSGKNSLVQSVARLVVSVNPTPGRPSVDEYTPIVPLDDQGNEVKSVSVNPEGTHVALRLVEAPANKIVYVSANLTGQPPFPYKVVRWSVVPSNVTLKGSPRALDQASTISTDPIDLGSATSDVQRYVNLRVPSGLEIQGSDRVRVTIKIEMAQPK